MLANQFHVVSSNDNYSNKFKNNSSNISFQLAHKLFLQEYQYKEFNASFCMTELEDSSASSNKTAVGANNISTEMLQHMPEHCLQTVLLLFDHIWFTGELPMCWLHSIIVLLHKLNKPTCGVAPCASPHQPSTSYATAARGCSQLRAYSQLQTRTKCVILQN